MQKIIFVIGGVISSVGKGVFTSSIGLLLKKQNLKILLKKMDPYFNIDAGTMDPIQHGEVFCTADGFETDLDIGHYERFMNENFSKISSITSGQIFNDVIKKERAGKYLGSTVQAIPHISDSIINNIFNTKGKKYDLIIIEIGGTIGDIEIQIFLEAARQIRTLTECCYILVSHVPYLRTSLEYKSKPTQRSVLELSASGIFPDFIIFRTEHKLPKNFFEKITSKINIDSENLINLPNLNNKFLVPLFLHNQKVDHKLMKFFNLTESKPNLSDLIQLNKKIKNSKSGILNIVNVGKYSKLPDAYLSITEACELSTFLNNYKPNIEFISSQLITKDNICATLKGADAVVIPGGFGTEGIEGKLICIKYCRENNICILGICLGFQLMVLEYLQTVDKVNDISNEELNPNAQNLAFIAHDDNVITNENAVVGGSMILGEKKCLIEPYSQAYDIYGERECSERFRHRYIFNTQFLSLINKSQYANFDIKMIDMAPVYFSIKNHPFFVGCQFHPEFNFKLSSPHKIFSAFIKKAISQKKDRLKNIKKYQFN